MSDPISLQILEELQDRLQTILVSGGFNTNAGQQVFLGERRINPNQLDDGPVINVFDTEDEIDETTAYGDEEIHITMRVIVAAYIRDVDEESTRLAHLILQDIKTAMLKNTDRTLGGLTVDFGYDGRVIEYPEPGGDTLHVSAEFVTTYQEPYGQP